MDEDVQKFVTKNGNAQSVCFALCLLPCSTFFQGKFAFFCVFPIDVNDDFMLMVIMAAAPEKDDASP